jgi:hypothetical protein
MITGVLWALGEWSIHGKWIVLCKLEELGSQGSLSFRLRVDGSQSCEYLQNTNSEMTTSNSHTVANV